MNTVITYFAFLHLLITITNCKNNSELVTTETCDNFESFNGLMRVMKSVNLALGDILASATLKSENIADDVCAAHKGKERSSSETDYCVERERDCSGYFHTGFKKNGVYTIWPNFLNHSVQVYCDMEFDDECGWTVIQRRGDFGKPHENFFRSWNEYKTGFGNLEEEFWLGNDIIFAMTNQAPVTLRIELEDFDGEKRYAKYLKFLIRSEVENYKLTVEGYSGTAGDAMKLHNGEDFQTKDTGSECVDKWKGGWWYEDCFRANLNGVFYNETEHLNHRDGITWLDFRDQDNSLRRSEMKIRVLFP